LGTGAFCIFVPLIFGPSAYWGEDFSSAFVDCITLATGNAPLTVLFAIIAAILAIIFNRFWFGGEALKIQLKEALVGLLGLFFVGLFIFLAHFLYVSPLKMNASKSLELVQANRDLESQKLVQSTLRRDIKVMSNKVENLQIEKSKLETEGRSLRDQLAEARNARTSRLEISSTDPVAQKLLEEQKKELEALKEANRIAQMIAPVYCKLDSNSLRTVKSYLKQVNPRNVLLGGLSPPSSYIVEEITAAIQGSPLKISTNASIRWPGFERPTDGVLVISNHQLNDVDKQGLAVLFSQLCVPWEARVDGNLAITNMIIYVNRKQFYERSLDRR